MIREEILKTVVAIVTAVSCWDGIKPLDENTNLQQIAIDSLDKIEVVIMVEKEFKINIRDEDVDQLETVGDIVNFVIKLNGDTAPTTGN